MFFDYGNGEEIESLLERMLTETKTKTNTSKLLSKLRSVMRLDDNSKILELVNTNKNVSNETIVKLKKFSKTNPTPREWKRLVQILPSEKKEEEILRFKDEVRNALINLDESIATNFATLTTNEKKGLELAIPLIVEELAEVEKDENWVHPDEKIDEVESLLGQDYESMYSYFNVKGMSDKILMALERMEQEGDMFRTTQGNVADKREIDLLNKDLLEKEEETEIVVGDSEIVEYTLSIELKRLFKFCKNLDKNLNSNKELSNLFRTMDRNKNQTLEDKETNKTNIENMKSLLIERFDDIKKAIENQIGESMKRVLEEGIVRGRTSNVKTSKNRAFEPIQWLTENLVNKKVPKKGK